ncbi:nicotinate phosphoribosyltransferase [Kickxella alabastrina]|uniref:Nicotinate phosphoribosyltransferase n=1 Tax=Kickxella alabastrina TaxID=61397 RepID=A0ACC1ITQ4_9FUNG|nr:nicotinate phosphoribosyltransferase [Kickxella alabastrina]
MSYIEENAPKSILDQDLYKFCMQQAVLEHYSDAHVEYGFINRDKTATYNRASADWLQSRIADLSEITATPADLEYLRATCPYLSAEYLEYLSTYNFNPSAEVACSLDESSGSLCIRISGKWCQVILYEIPLLSLISEAYFKHVDTDWNYDGQLERITDKGRRLVEAGCKFAEFGTRRRRDFKTQDIVMSGLVGVASDGPGNLTGTSNVYLARKYCVAPVGTVGHEWTMGIAALEGTYENGNSLALNKWHETFKGHLGIALTDTFGTKAFFANFGRDLATKYDGVRHDSGDPFLFTDAVCAHYASLGIDLSTKVIVFSDGLSPEIAAAIKKYADKCGVKSAYGIGTNFTNDFVCASDPSRPSKASNIVIKLFKCNDSHCVKLSDVASKHTGDVHEVEHAQSELFRAGLLNNSQ